MGAPAATGGSRAATPSSSAASAESRDGAPGGQGGGRLSLGVGTFRRSRTGADERQDCDPESDHARLGVQEFALTTPNGIKLGQRLPDAGWDTPGRLFPEAKERPRVRSQR